MGAVRGAGAEWWANTTVSTLVPLTPRMPDGAVGWLESAQLPGVVVSRLSGSGGGFARTADLISSHPGEAVLLSVALDGVLHISDGSRTTSGTTAFCFADRPYVIGSDSTYDVVTVRAPLSLLPARHEGLRHASPLGADHDQQVGLLRELSLSILSHDRHDAYERRIWSDVTIGLLSLLVRGGQTPTRDGGARAATFDAAIDVIERCHRDAALTIDDIARQCQVSRRELELVFALHGSSPASHVRRTRLRTSLDLLDEHARSATISSIAHEVGFTDVTTFARSFRREFQTTPHQWRTDHAAGGGVDASSISG